VVKKRSERRMARRIAGGAATRPRASGDGVARDRCGRPCGHGSPAPQLQPAQGIRNADRARHVVAPLDAPGVERFPRERSGQATPAPDRSKVGSDKPDLAYECRLTPRRRDQGRVGEPADEASGLCCERAVRGEEGPGRRVANRRIAGAAKVDGHGETMRFGGQRRVIDRSTFRFHRLLPSTPAGRAGFALRSVMHVPGIGYAGKSH
jgi:hypothetical protein